MYLNSEILNENIEIWQNNNIAENIVLARKKLNDLNLSEGIKQKITTNVDYLFKMSKAQVGFFCSSDDLRMQKAAKQSIINALVLFEIISSCAQGQPYNFADKMMQGAHVVLEDDGELSFLVSKLETSIIGNSAQVMHRYSSHYHAEKMAVIRDKNPNLSDDEIEKNVLKDKSDCSFRSEIIFNECVFGSFKRNGKTYSWLQFEGHSHQARMVYNSILLNMIDTVFKLFNYSIEKLSHHIDWLFYVLLYKRQVNVGQYGNSEHSETNAPLIINIASLDNGSQADTSTKHDFLYDSSTDDEYDECQYQNGAVEIK